MSSPPSLLLLIACPRSPFLGTSRPFLSEVIPMQWALSDLADCHFSHIAAFWQPLDELHALLRIPRLLPAVALFEKASSSALQARTIETCHSADEFGGFQQPLLSVKISAVVRTSSLAYSSCSAALTWPEPLVTAYVLSRLPQVKLF